MKKMLALLVFTVTVWLGWRFFTGSANDLIPLASDSATQTLRNDVQPAVLPPSSSTLPASEIRSDSVAEIKINGVDAAYIALKSPNQLVVREQFEVVKNCATLSRRQDDLRLLAAGVFDNAKPMPRSESEKSQMVIAAKRTLDECRDLLPLGVVALKDLSAKLDAHGKSLGSPLFAEAENSRDHRRTAVLLLTSDSPVLVEAGAYELLRGIASSDDSPTEQKSAELWDRALLIAGCQLGSYCDADSIQSQQLCLQSRICNTSIRDFWLSKLSAEEVAVVNERVLLLAKWLRSPASKEIVNVVSHTDLAKALGK